MNNRLAAICLTAPLLISLCSAHAQPVPAATTNAVTKPHKLSIQGALTFGPTPMKMHALSTITQHRIKGAVDETYLPGFKACAEDTSPAVRSLAAKMLGEYYIQNQPAPNPEALQTLEKLASDPSADVRYNALFSGLTEVVQKSDNLVKQLVDAAAVNREEGLYAKIIESLSKNKDTASAYIEEQLKTGTSIAYYEIYTDLMKKKPADSEQYRDLPSSQPQLFVFTTGKADKELSAVNLKKWVENLGIQSSHVEVSGYAGQRVLLLTTYITRDNEKVLDNLSGLPADISYMSKFWLTPKLATDIEMVRKREAR
ncbi:HEAT repeat domain-containing protein [Pontiella agarivorans]|uniref:HEAT repeat domain-containing protein n=1 Tax=Pontiella agarivorans TaxID=3038953 RepID=A0ABU5MUN2_9BACT|nr:HEAT repeat domain-containing protein [Pontiella agarivorans]MDZ8117923.1 HEAT repeat domain-containing protein [Pontiella agarivorans]